MYGVLSLEALLAELSDDDRDFLTSIAE